MENSILTGVWALKSFDLFLASAPNEGPIFQPLGDEPLGRILFTSENYMACTLTSRIASEPIESATWQQANDNEVLNAARTFTTYSGPFKLYTNGKEDFLETQVEIALDPNWIGKPQVRRWEVIGNNKLILKPVQEFSLPVS